MAKKEKKLNKSTWVKGVLRRASLRWPPRNEALVRARVARGDYECAMCKGIFKRQQVDLDHISPVVDVEDGFTGFDEFVETLFCDVENFAVLCKECHAQKTSLEVQYRKYARRKKKGNEEETDT